MEGAPKSSAVAPGFRSTCGQETASSMGQTAKFSAALTLEDQSGFVQTQGTGTRKLNCRFQKKMRFNYLICCSGWDLHLYGDLFLYSVEAALSVFLTSTRKCIKVTS